MSRSIAPRHLLLGAVALALVAGSGCSWVKRKFTTETRYEDSGENRPLEMPPGLDVPRNTSTMQIPAVGTGAAAAVDGMPPARAAGPVAVSDFQVADSVDSTWRRLGIALERTEGVSITSRAQALNSYEVSFKGTSMLIRAEASAGQSRVSAVGTDGLPMTSGAATELLGLLQARLN